MLKWAPIYHIQLDERFEAWLQEQRDRHHQYNEEQILFAAVACGLDWLRRDEKSALTLERFYPPLSTAELFPTFAVRVLAGRICTYTESHKPRMYTGHAWQ